MIVKIVTLFLIFIGVLAMFGRLKLRWPSSMRVNAGKCRHCGRHKIGKGPCPCGEGRG